MPDIYYKHSRRKSILKASDRFNIGDKTIYKYLKKYLQSGKIKNSLLPNFHRCGGKGKRRNSSQKLGRPRNTFYVEGKRKGINIDDEVRKIFEIGIERYYNNSKEMSIPQAFEQIKPITFLKAL